MKRFEVLDHTADIGLVVHGESLEALFQNAAEGLFHIMTDLKKVACRVEKPVRLKGESPERLIVTWLNELLYLHDVEHLLLKEFKIDSVGEEGLEAVVKGEPFQDGVHVMKTEVKAVTYHQIEVRQKNNYWRARIIIDL